MGTPQTSGWFRHRLTCEKDEYLIFLRNLYLRISEPSITGSRQFRRVDAVVSVETPDLTAILKEGEVLKADRELDDTEIQQMNDDFESSRQSDVELGIAPRGSGLEARADEEAARPSRRTVAPGGSRRRTSVARLSAQAQRRSSVAATRAAKESEIPNFKGSYLGRFPLVLADFWTSDHLSERPRSVDAFSGTRARGTLTLKRR